MSATHTCPHPECKEVVPDEMFACRPHWYSLPVTIRNDVWRAFRNSGVGSAKLRVAHEAAMEWWDNRLKAERAAAQALRGERGET